MTTITSYPVPARGLEDFDVVLGSVDGQTVRVPMSAIVAYLGVGTKGSKLLATLAQPTGATLIGTAGGALQAVLDATGASIGQVLANLTALQFAYAAQTGAARIGSTNGSVQSDLNALYASIGQAQQAIGDWPTIRNEFVTVEQFARTGDTDDAAAFQRAADYMDAKNILGLRLQPRAYDTSSMAVTFNTAVQMEGGGFTESGNVNGFNANLSGRGNVAYGTWIRCGLTNDRAFKFNNADCRGSRIDRIGFVQSHPDPNNGWAPTPYDYIIDNQSAYGGIEIGDVMFLGINKGIYCDDSGRLFVRRLRGQCFTNAITIERCLDVPTVEHMHFWPFASAAVPVLTYQQANLDLLVLRRCDGFMGGKIFSFASFSALRMEPGQENPGGTVSDYMIDSLYSDFGRFGVYIDAPGAFGHINNLTTQCENWAAGDGSALPDSCGIYLSANSGGGYHSITRHRAERFAQYAVANNSNSTVECVEPSFVRNSDSGNMYYSATGWPTNLLRPPIYDATIKNLGTPGKDFSIVNGDEIEYLYAVTTDANGAVLFAHNLGSNAPAGLSDVFGEVKGNSGESIGMTYQYLDANNVSLTSAYPNRPCRITVRMRRYFVSW